MTGGPLELECMEGLEPISRDVSLLLLPARTCATKSGGYGRI